MKKFNYIPIIEQKKFDAKKYSDLLYALGWLIAPIIIISFPLHITGFIMSLFIKEDEEA